MAENSKKVLEIQNQIESNEYLALVSPSRKFIREGNFTVIENSSKEKERTIYLFNDLIIFTKPRRNMNGKDKFRYKLFLYNAKITDIAEDGKNLCEISEKQTDDDDYSQNSSYLIFFPNNDEKQSWVKEIKVLLRDYQKLCKFFFFFFLFFTMFCTNILQL